MLPESQPLRDELYSKFLDYTLLRNRMFALTEKLGRTDKILKTLKEHEMKVEWQLRRIYRTRNLIVHSGRTPAYCNVLIENIHTYVDAFLETVLRLSMKDQSINTIEEAVELARLKKEKYVKTLSSGNNPINRDNYICCLLQ